MFNYNYQPRTWTQADFDENLREIDRLNDYLQAVMDEQASFGHPGEPPRDNQYEAAHTRFQDTIAIIEAHLPDLDEDPTVQAAQAEIDQTIQGIEATAEGFLAALANDPTPATVNDAEEFFRDADAFIRNTRRMLQDE